MGCAAVAAKRNGPVGRPSMVQPSRRATSLLAVVLLAGCLSGADGDGEVHPDEPGGAWLAGPDHVAFTSTQARELDLVSDRDDPTHLSLAYIVPRDDLAFPSWLAYAKSEDGG